MMDYIDKTYEQVCKLCKDKDEYPICAVQCYGFMRQLQINKEEVGMIEPGKT
jgi:hypothetical protein